MMSYYSFAGPGSGATAIMSPHSPIWKTPQWSMAMWIKTTGTVNTQGVLSTSLIGNSTTVGVCWEGSGRGLYVDLQGNQAPVADLTSSSWHHVAVTYDS